MTEPAPADNPLSDEINRAADESPDELTPTRFVMERALLVMGERTELILVRHAQQVRTMAEAYRSGGPRLSDVGREQALLTGRHLAADVGAP